MTKTEKFFKNKTNYFARFIFVIIGVLFYPSCATVHLNLRKGQDQFLNDSNYKIIEGRYSNVSIDSSKKTLMLNFDFDTIAKNRTAFVSIKAANSKSIELNLTSDDSIILSRRIVGSYRKGYFQIKRKWLSSLSKFPLILLFKDDIKYLGLTKSSDLIFLDSGGIRIAFFIVIPFVGNYIDEVHKLFYRLP